jgi:pimeloyl-ACP methyl ester carboxylesterase
MTIQSPTIPTAEVLNNYTTSSVRSKDGTSIGYRQYGHGPGVVLVQGAMGFAENFSALAEALSEAFTVYVPDRRGRGMSPLAYHKDHTIQRDIEDLDALLAKTSTHHVFGLSSGAVITLAAAIGGSDVHKLAVFEPVLFEGRPLPTEHLARYDRAIQKGDIAAALTAAGKAVGLAPLLTYTPDWLLTLLMKMTLANEAKQPEGSDPSLSEIALTLQYDFQDVAELHKTPKNWRAVQAEVLLLGGGKSPKYLKADLDFLEKALAHATRKTFTELGHAAAWNYDKQRNPTGNPELVAQELRRFFA